MQVNESLISTEITLCSCYDVRIALLIIADYICHKVWSSVAKSKVQHSGDYQKTIQCGLFTL